MTVSTSVERVRSVLDGAAHVYVAIRTRSGPHVTPELFTVSGERILCLTSAATLKAKLLRNDPFVSVVARAGDAAAVALGSVQVLDPASPATAVQSPLLAAASPAGVGRFIRDNSSELMGAAADFFAGRLGGPLPPHRVIVALTPVAFAVIEGDDMIAADGWTAAGQSPPEGDPDANGEPELTDVPDRLACLAIAGPAVAGWVRHDGTPLALPVEWDPETSTARLPAALFEVCEAALESPACVTFDTWTGFGPSGKQGIMLRGSGRATSDGASVCLSLDIRRATHWDGIQTATAEIAGGGPS